jgi:ethanolamine utilization protein EutA
VVLVVDADLAASIGRILVDDLGWRGPALLCLDGLEVGELDFLDIGRPAPSGGACPVVVKSLLFASPKDEPGAVPGHAMAGQEGGQAR